MTGETLPQSFYDRDTAAVAMDLIGTVLVHEEDGTRNLARIVETEAYLGMVDPASHVFHGLTDRTRTWGLPGRAYVFSIHGHLCLNAITLSTWPFGCVLIRGIRGVEDEEKVEGPGRLTKAFGITKEHDGEKLYHPGGCLRIHRAGYAVESLIVKTPRIGISKAKDMALRFYEEAL